MIPGLIGGGIAALALALAGLPLMLGAHPFWAMQVIWIGTAIGLPLGLILGRWRPGIATAVGIGAVIAGYLVATTGKTRFAASFAEDAVAGQMWYFGWIATCAAIVLTAATIAQAVRRKA